MNPFSIIKYQLYLLQLENYEIGRFWPLLLKKGYFGTKEPLRKSLVWTAKAKTIFLLSFLIWFGLTAFIITANPIFGLIAFVILFLIFPILYLLSLILLMPIDYFTKLYSIAKAKKIIRHSCSLKVIGIAGSYGKTTMKSVLSSVLSAKFKVLATPESVNTPIGIANWILKNFKKETEILIIEMGEHYKGDIKYLCTFTTPDIAVVTGINEAHFERLNSLENIVATVFEIAESAKENATIILNADDKNIRDNYQKYTAGKNIKFYSAKNDSLSESMIKSKTFNTENLNWIVDSTTIGEFKVSALGEYMIGATFAAIATGQLLSMSEPELKRGIAKIASVEHRLQPIRGEGNVLVIDDSYNGNPDGAAEAIKVLSRFEKRRKIYITPGLVEAGQANKAVHEKIGQLLAKVADKVILIKNSATPFIAAGLAEAKFADENIIWFNTAEEAHKSLGNILKPEDVILFQNDWGDQYL